MFIIYRRLFLIILLFSYFPSFSQKEFDLKLVFPKGFNSKKLDLSVDNGKVEKPLTISNIENDTISLSGTYYGKYATIILRYPKKLNSIYQGMFFLSRKPATIVFHRKGVTQSPFEHYELNNAYDLKREKDNMAKYDSGEVKAIDDYIAKYGNKIFDGSDSALSNEFTRLDRKLLKRDIQYILNHGSSYYAFLYFRRNIVSAKSISPDSIMHIFNEAFPDSFRLSEEGNTITTLLRGRMNIKKNGIAPVFRAKDINGKEIDLQEYRNKKYVLLTFWATWCGPCIVELPKIKEINEKYSSKGLVTISVSYRSQSYSSYLAAIKEYKMNWINIYDNINLINSYGGNMPIPRVYLINKDGKIIYAYDATSENRNNTLAGLKRILQRRLIN